MLHPCLQPCATMCILSHLLLQVLSIKVRVFMQAAQVSWSVDELLRAVSAATALQAIRIHAKEHCILPDGKLLPPLTALNALHTLHLANLGFSVGQAPMPHLPPSLRALNLNNYGSAPSQVSELVELPHGFRQQRSMLTALHCHVDIWGAELPSRLQKLHLCGCTNGGVATEMFMELAARGPQMLNGLSGLSCLRALSLQNCSWLAEVGLALKHASLQARCMLMP